MVKKAEAPESGCPGAGLAATPRYWGVPLRSRARARWAMRDVVPQLEQGRTLEHELVAVG